MLAASAIVTYLLIANRPDQRTKNHPIVRPPRARRTLQQRPCTVNEIVVVENTAYRQGFMRLFIPIVKGEGTHYYKYPPWGLPSSAITATQETRAQRAQKTITNAPRHTVLATPFRISHV